MTTNIKSCPIWGTPLEGPTIKLIDSQNGITWNGYDSPRAGGSYRVATDAAIGELSAEEKARLTTWLVDQRLQGNQSPRITETTIKSIKTKRSLQVHERADRLLRFIAQQSQTVSNRVMIGEDELRAYAWSESIEWQEVSYFLEYLRETAWIDGDFLGNGQSIVFVTVAGHNRIGELTLNADSSQAFVAMWFDNSLTDAYENGIELGIIDAGFKPLILNRKDHINKIEDEVIAEIRKSKFLVADFTHGNDGARGSVYYEAGFAHGLGIPVIFTCRKNSMKTLHFDIAHYSHIVWSSPADLREKLRNRIHAVIV